MKREINFRGKNPKDGKWYYGSLVLDYDKKPMILVAGYCDGFGFSGSMYVTPETVGQFTGLKDKNGKDIYEEDILSFPNMDNPTPEAIIYKEGSFQTYDGYSLTSLNQVDTLARIIIGNIHDNPELLKGGEE